MRDDWTISVNLILEGSIEMLLLDRIRHDDQEEVKVLALFRLAELSTLSVLTTNVGAVVVIYSVFKGLNT